MQTSYVIAPQEGERGIGAGRAFAGKRKEEIGGEEGRGGSQFRKSISELSFPDCLLREGR